MYSHNKYLDYPTFPKTLDLVRHDLLRRPAPPGQQRQIPSVDADGIHAALISQTTEGLLK